jgi:hypothetical protein
MDDRNGHHPPKPCIRAVPITEAVPKANNEGHNRLSLSGRQRGRPAGEQAHQFIHKLDHGLLNIVEVELGKFEVTIETRGFLLLYVWITIESGPPPILNQSPEAH